MTETPEMVPYRAIELRILRLRNQKVMLSHDLAALYGVETKVLIQAVKRNTVRFPEDFMFQLTAEEYANLKSQIVTSSWGGHPPGGPAGNALRWEDVDALLELGDHYSGPPRLTSGLVEMQRIFMKAAPHPPLGTRGD